MKEKLDTILTDSYASLLLSIRKLKTFLKQLLKEGKPSDSFMEETINIIYCMFFDLILHGKFAKFLIVTLANCNVTISSDVSLGSLLFNYKAYIQFKT